MRHVFQAPRGTGFRQAGGRLWLPFLFSWATETPSCEDLQPVPSQTQVSAVKVPPAALLGLQKEAVMAGRRERGRARLYQSAGSRRTCRWTRGAVLSNPEARGAAGRTNLSCEELTWL